MSNNSRLIHHTGSGDTAVLLFHSLTASSSETDYLASFLHKTGIPVFQAGLAGHGNITELEKTDFQIWLEAAEADLITAKNIYPQVIVGGLSTGALLALHLAANHDIKACFSIAPALVIKSMLASITGILGFFRIKKKNRVLEQFRKWYLPQMPFRSIYQTWLLGNRLRSSLHQISCPLLSCHSMDDRIIAKKSSQLLFYRTASENKELFLFTRGVHLPVIDQSLPMSEEITKKIINFIKDL